MTRAEQQQERQEWEKRITDFRSSGLSASKWCAVNDVKLYRLRYRLRQEKGGVAGESAPTAWLRASVSVPDTGLLVRVGDAVIEVRPGFDPDLLSAVVRTLSATC